MKILSAFGLISAAAMAGLLATVIALPQDWPAVLGALVQLLLILGANSLGVRVAGRLLHLNVDGVAWRSSAAAAWFAPLAVYLRADSLYAIPMAAIVVAMVASLFRKEETIPRPQVVDDGLVIHLLEIPSMSRLLSLVIAGLCLQTGLAMGAAGTLGLAVALVGAAIAVIAWHAQSLRTNPLVQRPLRQTVSAGLTLLLAFLLTTAALQLGTGGSGNPGGLEDTAANGPGGKYWGIYLWPEVSTKAQQISSAPVIDANPLHDRVRVPLKIRFDGVYWYFRFPNLQPPRSASVMHGSPEELGFRSADDTPLMVEAHQNLTDHVDLSGCDRIEVAVRNADLQPGTVEAELILADSRTPGVLLSLGQAAIVSRILRFSLPDNPPLSSFDELTVRFHLHEERATRSPRIAVDALELIPR